jgi:hypothetical protein
LKASPDWIANLAFTFNEANVWLDASQQTVSVRDRFHLQPFLAVFLTSSELKRSLDGFLASILPFKSSNPAKPMRFQHGL